ncbi:MAG: hypothetical protein NTX91_01335 [candidate division SR1 bacterium]|nr:hypothetical protein [candidate division SR1 bacterium]
MAITIKVDPYEGSEKIEEIDFSGRIINESQLKQQSEYGARMMKFPVKKERGSTRMEFLTPDHCKQNIDLCPAPCGSCIIAPGAEHSLAFRINYVDVFDLSKFKAHA